MLSFPLADESEYGTAGQPYKSPPEVRGSSSAARALSGPLGAVPGTSDSGSLHGSTPGYKGLSKQSD